MNLSVAQALDDYIAAIEEERLPDGKYHPSSFWLCARAAILGVRGIPQSSPPDAQTKRVFRIGHMMHALVQEALPKGAGVKNVYVEFEIDVPEWNMAGHGDILVELDNGDWWVIEIKSTKSLRYTPKEDHLKQASIYFCAARDFGYWVEKTERFQEEGFQPPLGDKLKGVILAYLNKQDMEVKEYPYPADKRWRPAIEKRVKMLDKFRLPDGTTAYPDSLPDPLPLDRGKPNWYTNYCPYRGSGACCGDSKELFEQYVKEGLIHLSGSEEVYEW